jgi:hypothetical protein
MLDTDHVSEDLTASIIRVTNVSGQLTAFIIRLVAVSFFIT